ncbi:MAG: DUF6638 family protein [Maricaulaceae bacterium]
MMRLIERGLMYGNLIEVSAPGMVARYNRAMKRFTGLETKLTEFHIDISGFSPEIGHEIENDLYLNPKGCNQQFILLTPSQKTAPLLSTEFSTSRKILRDYIVSNEDELFALTAREAVTGELMDSVYRIDSPADLMAIQNIHIEADTISDRVKGAETLKSHIERFMGEEDAWWDDVLIAEMVELAKTTGNIYRNPVKLSTKSYTQGCYYTSHYGGVYIFRDLENQPKNLLITKVAAKGFEDYNGTTVYDVGDRQKIANFLHNNNLIEPVVTTRGARAGVEIIKQKIDFIIIATLAELGEDLSDLSRQDIRFLTRKYIDDMPQEYHGLVDVVRWFDGDGEHPKFGPEHAAYFYKFRASQHEHRDLVNRLLAQLSPLDFRQLFICHKSLFYATYKTWSDEKREYVARFLAEEYAADKDGTRELLYGSWPARYAPPKDKDDKTKDKRKSSKSKRGRKPSSARAELPQNRGNKPYRRRDKKHNNPWGEPLIKDGNYYVKLRKRHRDDDD